MKTKFLLALSLLFTGVMYAQVSPSFGIRAGVSSAAMKGDAVNSLKNVLDVTNGIISTSNRTGFYAGAYSNIPLSEIVSIEPGLYYSQKGYELKGAFSMKGLSFLEANARAKLNAGYIDLPVAIKADISGFQVFAGPQVSYLLNADLRATGGVFGINLLNTKTNVTQQFNRWDAGLTGGIGYRFGNGLNVTAAYDYGLSKVDANQNLKSYNRVLKVGIGMQF
jgi:hypothetical protein